TRSCRGHRARRVRSAYGKRPCVCRGGARLEGPWLSRPVSRDRRERCPAGRRRYRVTNLGELVAPLTPAARSRSRLVNVWITAIARHAATIDVTSVAMSTPVAVRSVRSLAPLVQPVASTLLITPPKIHTAHHQCSNGETGSDHVGCWSRRPG